MKDINSSYSIRFLFPLIIFISFFFNTNLQAQSELSFDIFTQEEGLPNNQVQCIFQDSKGWIWIGTSQGLSRFSGYEFTNYLPTHNDSISLKGNLIRVIKENRDGNLLIGTENGGLNIFDREKEIFVQPYKNDPAFRNIEFSVNDIFETPDGTLWLASDFNLLKMDKDGKINEISPILKKGTKSLQNTFIRNLKPDKKGKLWVGTNDGLYIYNPFDNTLESLELPFEANQNREIWELFLDDDGSMWIGTYSSGLFIADTETKQLQQINLFPKAPRTETVRAISKGIFGEYWIGTRGGLFKYAKKAGVSGFYLHNAQEPRSLSNNSILSIYHDKRGETWIGTRGGLNLLAKSKQVFHNYTAHPGNNKYLNSSTVYALWEDTENKIWIGTEDGGINIYDPRTESYTYLTTEGKKGYTIAQNCIKAFLNDGKGNLWVGTYLGGIDVINLKNGRITNYKFEPDVSNSLSDNRVWDICMDVDGNIWVASSKGVDRFDHKSSSFIHYSQLNGHQRVIWIEHDSKGNLWMGSTDEVIVFNQQIAN